MQKKAYKTKHDYDDYIVIEKGTTHSLLAMYLVDRGVAITRAKKSLHIVQPNTNMYFDI